MRILMLNTVYAVGSTGKIVKQIEELAESVGFECMVAHRYEIPKVKYSKNCISVSSWLDCHIHNRIARHTMLRGCFSKIKTYLFLKKAKSFNPDIIHIHNIHGNFVNLKMLFKYIKRHNVKVIWTFHDCWPLTGKCEYFDMVACENWKTNCSHCSQKGESVIDISSFMHKYKKKLFSGIEDMTIVTPSDWLANLARQSFLHNYPIKVINNGIDLSIFKPVGSEFRQKYSLDSKKIILGVAFDWGVRKGLDIFIELASRLPDYYQIVLVGTNDTVDSTLPNNIISIHKTNNQEELAAIYTAADLFVNPTREDNYPTVNMEALACGTPVLTFKTGGSPEMLNESCGSVVNCDDIDALEQEIVRIIETKPYSQDACLKKAKSFDMNDKIKEYVGMYENSSYITKFGL